jgi:hypothetical protein
MTDIIIKSIPIKDMRWGILGDYFEPKNCSQKILVAETSNEIKNRLLAIHELVETTLLIAHGITVQEIDAYCDKKKAEGAMPDSDEADSPIYKEHQIADICERIVCQAAGIKWKEYDNDLDKILNNKDA